MNMKKIFGLILWLCFINFVNWDYILGTEYIKFIPDWSSFCKINRINEFKLSSDSITKKHTKFTINLLFKNNKLKKGDFLQIKVFDSSDKKAKELISFDKQLEKTDKWADIDLLINDVLKNFKWKNFWISLSIINWKKSLETCKFPIRNEQNFATAKAENEFDKALTWAINLSGNDFSFYRCKDRFCFDKKLFLTRNRVHWNISWFNLTTWSISFSTDSKKISSYISAQLKTWSCILMVDQQSWWHSFKLNSLKKSINHTYKDNYSYNLWVSQSADCELNWKINQEIIYKNWEQKTYARKLSFQWTGFSTSWNFIKLAKYNNQKQSYDINYFLQDWCSLKDLVGNLKNKNLMFVKSLKDNVSPSMFNLFNVNNYSSWYNFIKNADLFKNIEISGSKLCNGLSKMSNFSIIKEENNSALFAYKFWSWFNIWLIYSGHSYLTNFSITELLTFDINNWKLNLLFKDDNNKYIYFNWIISSQANFLVYNDMIWLCDDPLNKCEWKVLIWDSWDSKSKTFVLKDTKLQLISDNKLFSLKLDGIDKIKYLDDGNLVFVWKIYTWGDSYLFKFPNYFYPLGHIKVEDIEMVNDRIVLLTESKVVKVYEKDFVQFSDESDLDNKMLQINLDSFTWSFNWTGTNSIGRWLYFSGCTINWELMTWENSIKCIKSSVKSTKPQQNIENTFSANIWNWSIWYTMWIFIFIILWLYLYLVKYGYRGTDVLNFSIYWFMSSLLGLLIYKMHKYRIKMFVRWAENKFIENVILTFRYIKRLILTKFLVK